jgi:hypothetical protein
MDMARQGWKDDDLTFLPRNTVQGQVALLQRGDAQAMMVSPPNDVLGELPAAMSPARIRKPKARHPTR